MMKTEQDEGTHEMEKTNQRRVPSGPVLIGRIGAMVVVVGGLTAAAFAVGTASAVTSRSQTSAVVSTTNHGKLGTILVSGTTLYTLKPSRTTCGARCLKVWPPLLLPNGVSQATAGAGVDASKLGTVEHAGGVLQVTYNGKALYWFIGDKAAGQVKGNITDKWGKWSTVVTVKATNAAGSSGGKSTGGGTNAGTGGVSF